jgi:hypothetical protein
LRTGIVIESSKPEKVSLLFCFKKEKRGLKPRDYIFLTGSVEGYSLPDIESQTTDEITAAAIMPNRNGGACSSREQREA